MTRHLIGIDLGATRIKSVLLDEDGNRVHTHDTATNDREDAPWLDDVRDTIALLESAVDVPADSIGLCAPGFASRDGRSIAWMQGRMAAVQGLDWTGALDRSIRVMNDGHAALLGEVWQGAARGAINAVLLTLGTGVGGAVLCDGRILRGHLGRAGHLGHIALDPDAPLDIVNTPGSLEDAIGECTIGRRTRGKFQNSEELLYAADTGDEAAWQTWDRSVYLLACGIASIVNVVDPQVVVIGGGIAEAGYRLFEPLRAHLDRVEWRPHGSAVEIRKAKLGPLAGAYGAAYHAHYHDI